MESVKAILAESATPGSPIPMSVPGAKIMLLGDTGAGKTYSIRTLLDANVTPFVIFTEPGMEVLMDVAGDPCRIHWHYVPPATPDWNTLIDNAKKINALDIEGLTKQAGINKARYGEFLDLLKTLSNFRCDRCGQEFGSVTAWGPERALVIDSLSGLNVMATNLVVGAKPVKSLPEWGIILDNLERLLIKLTTDLKCFFVLTAHMERETDEMTGGVQLMASTMGRKLAPKLPRFFSDVIHATRQETKFTWSTSTPNAVLKARNIPLAAGQAPSFKPLVDSWRARQAGREKSATSSVGASPKT